MVLSGHYSWKCLQRTRCDGNFWGYFGRKADGQLFTNLPIHPFSGFRDETFKNE